MIICGNIYLDEINKTFLLKCVLCEKKSKAYTEFTKHIKTKHKTIEPDGLRSEKSWTIEKPNEETVKIEDDDHNMDNDDDEKSLIEIKQEMEFLDEYNDEVKYDVALETEASTSSFSVVSDLDHNVIKSKIESGEYSLQNKRGRSRVWETISNIINDKGEMISSHVSCKSCCKVFKYNQKTTSNLTKHKCYLMMNDSNHATKVVDVDSETRRKTAIICTQWTLLNCRPFKIVQDSGFTKIIEEAINIGAKFGPHVNLNSLLPHPSTISRNINKLYDIHFTKVKNEISEIKEKGFALSSNIWTDNYLRKSYLALTIHYIHNGFMYSKLLSMITMEGEKATHTNILQEVEISLQLYDCGLNNKSTIVTDRGSNMVAAFKPHNHVFCCAHLWDNVLQNSMLAVEEVEKLCRSCTKLVKYFKVTGLNSTLKKTSLKSYTPTWWYSLYAVFKSIEANWAEIGCALHERKQLNRISDIQLNHVNEMIAILEPFQEAFQKLKGENYPTIHLVFIYAHYLKKKCKNGPSDSEFTTQLKNKILENIDTILFKNLNLIHKLAIFLYPPTNKMLQFDAIEKENVRLECMRIMEMFVDLLPVQAAQEQVALSSDEPMFDFIDQVKNESFPDRISIELNTYESIIIHHTEDFNVLQWWELHKKQFPLLYYTSCKVLCTPATSAASERVFSQARNLISEKRCNIASNHESINKIMFLHSNIKDTNLQIEDIQ